VTTKDESEALAWAEGRRLDAKGRTDPEPHARTLASGLRSRETGIEKFEAMEVEYLDTIRRQEAVIEIVDRHSGAWGHINLDQILFSDVNIEHVHIIHAILLPHLLINYRRTSKWDKHGKSASIRPLNLQPLPRSFHGFHGLTGQTQTNGRSESNAQFFTPLANKIILFNRCIFVDVIKNLLGTAFYAN